MNPIPLELRKNSFNYKQIARTEKKAIYEQRTDEGVLIAYEIFKIKQVKEWVMADKTIEAHEKFPSDNDFGVLAWTVGRDFDYAMRRYNDLQTDLQIKDI